MSQSSESLNKKAVALSYDENKKEAPIIVASGMGYMAEKIIETATESGIPIYEDNSLATILTQLELGSEIPPELYQAIVDIYIYFLNFADGGKQQLPADGEQPPDDEQNEQNEEDAALE